MKEDEYINEFNQLPSKTGKDVIDLEEYAKLPRTTTYERIKEFIAAARKSKRDINICFIVAEWGEGKTSIYEGLLQKQDIIGSDLVIPLSTKRLIMHIKEKAEEFSDTGSIGIRLFAYLLYTIKDTVDNDFADLFPFSKIKIKPKEKQQATISFILDGLRSIFNVLPENSRVFIFIDEFEDILDESTEIRQFITRGLVDIINGYPRCLYQEPFAGRLHFLIAVTPPAYEKLKAETYADRQRLFGQRVLSIELEKLDRKNAYDYILGMLKYCWQGNLPKIPFSEPGMFNAIYTATLGNPRSIVNLVEKLLTYAKVNAPDGKIKIINPRDFVNALSDLEIEVYGGEVNLLDKDSLSMLYRMVVQKCKERGLEVNKCIDIFYFLLSNLSPISIGDLGEKVGLKEKDVREYLGVLGASFNELWSIDRPFIFFKKITGNVHEIRSKLITPKTPSNVSKVINALEFYEFDKNGLSFKSVLFVPHQQLGGLTFDDRGLFQNYIDFFASFSPELRSEDEIIYLVDRYVFDKVEKSYEDYVMLSPTTINVFYPSPSIFFLDFIEDLNKRFEVGTKLMRNLTIFEGEFHEGVFNLLQNECENIKVERVFESYGYGKDVEVIDLIYKEATQKYHLRAYVLPLLKISKEDFHDKIKAAIDKMRIAHIPLLIIFSWNPLPNELKGVLETLLILETSPRTERSPERVFYCLEFPLTFIQCQQICGYIIAKENKYEIKEEKWRARASKILNEVKFEGRLKEFISEGLSSGYTIKPLILSALKPDWIPGIIRTLFVTEGNIEERYKQIQEIEKKFKLYGKGFPICPIDIESEGYFEKYINELKENGLVEVDGESIKLDLTPVERRILSILREYNGVAKKDDIDKLFISTLSQGSPIITDIYLKILVEKRKIEEFDRGIFRIVGSEKLDNVFKRLKDEIDEYRKKYAQFQYGYLASIKQRDVNVIIVKDCIEEIASIADDLDKIRFIPGYGERRVRKQVLLELLVSQLREIIALVDEFYKGFSRMVSEIETKVQQIKISLDNYEKSINNLRLLDKTLRIKERLSIEEKEKSIEELKNKVYDSNDIIEYSLKFKEQINYFDNLYREFRDCPTFDVKMIHIISNYEGLKKIIENAELMLNRIEKLMDSIKLREPFKEHELLASKYKNKLSSLIQDWIKKNMESIAR